MADKRIYELSETLNKTDFWFVIDKTGNPAGLRFNANNIVQLTDLDAYYTKVEVDILLDDYYTKVESDALYVDLVSAQTASGIKTWNDRANFMNNVGIAGSASGSFQLKVNGIASAFTYIFDANPDTSVDKDGSSNLVFTDTVTGSKTLAELAQNDSGIEWAGGASGQLGTWFDAETIEAHPEMHWSGTEFTLQGAIKTTKILFSPLYASTIEEDGFANMSFTDLNEGTKTLYELALGNMNWQNLWVQSAYLKGALVRDGLHTMWANKDTSDRPAPQPQGPEFWLYQPLIPPTNSVLAKQIIFGTRFTFLADGYINAYRIYTVVGNHYTIYVVADPLGVAEITQVADFVSDVLGWVEIPIFAETALIGFTLDLVAVTNEPDPAPVTWTANYDYETPNNVTVPAGGEIQHANNAVSVLRINKTDNDLIDRTAQLLALSVGDVIRGAGMTWSIQIKTDQGTYWDFGVAPAQQGSPDGVGLFEFDTVAAVAITYMEDVAHWVPTPSIEGLFIADGDYTAIVPDTNAYGADLLVQDAYVSPDWELVALIGGGGSGGGAVGLEWSGNTVGGIGTFVDASTIQAEAGLTYIATLLTTPSAQAGTYYVGNVSNFITQVAGDIIFTDVNTGTKTLAQLAQDTVGIVWVGGSTIGDLGTYSSASDIRAEPKMNFLLDTILIVDNTIQANTFFYVGNSGNTITHSAGDMIFQDANTGPHTLTALAAGGGGGAWISDANGIHYGPTEGQVGIGVDSSATYPLIVYSNLASGNSIAAIFYTQEPYTAYVDFPTASVTRRTLYLGDLNPNSGVNNYNAIFMISRPSGTQTASVTLAIEAVDVSTNAGQFNVQLSGNSNSKYTTPLKVRWDSTIFWQTNEVGNPIRHVFVESGTNKAFMGWDTAAQAFGINAISSFAAPHAFSIYPTGDVAIGGLPEVSRFTSKGPGTAGWFIRETGAAASAVPYGVLNVKLTTTSSNPPSGPGIYFQIEEASGTSNNIGAVGCLRSGADNSGEIGFWVYQTGTRKEVLTLNPSGYLYLPFIRSLSQSNFLRYGTSSNEVSYLTSSDITLKENIEAWEPDSLQFLKEQPIITYDRKDGSMMNELGYDATKMRDLMPDLTWLDDEGLVNYGDALIPFHFHRAIKQLLLRIEQLENQI